MADGTLRRGGVVCAVALGSVTVGAIVVPGVAQNGHQSPFTDEAEARGIVYTPDQNELFGDGLAFADLDDDGDADVVLLGRADGLVGVYENDGSGFFTDRSATTGIPALPSFSGVVAGDYDRDGDLDLYVSCTGVTNALLRNDGGFQFTDVSDDAGVGDPGLSTGCGWGDFDGDGWLDLFVSNRLPMAGASAPHRLYRNQGDGSFTDTAADHGVDIPEHGSFQGTFFDYDLDGDSDLYVIATRGFCVPPLNSRSRLFENVGGTFQDVTDLTNTEACGVDAMSIALGDFDGNGFNDIYITNVPDGNALLMNSGQGVFSRDELVAGVASWETGWGAEFFDYDNDGILDLYVCNQNAPNRLYRHEGNWPCSDLSSDLGVDVGGNSYGVASADVDLDGDLDLLVSNRQEPIRLFINNEGQKRNWARFDVLGRGIDRYAIGAIIRVRTGVTWQVREIVAGHNYKTQNELVAQVGLGETAIVDEVRVTWPGGVSRIVRNLPTDRTWTIYPFDKLGDGDRDGDRDPADLHHFVGCWTDDAPGSITPGCEMMDHIGDGDVDMSDFLRFMAAYDGALIDCDADGVVDIVQILEGTAADADLNGIIDTCQLVPGDTNADGTVDVNDLVAILGVWGPCIACLEDVDGDGDVDVNDLLLVLANWG